MNSRWQQRARTWSDTICKAIGRTYQECAHTTHGRNQNFFFICDPTGVLYCAFLFVHVTTTVKNRVYYLRCDIAPNHFQIRYRFRMMEFIFCKFSQYILGTKFSHYNIQTKTAHNRVNERMSHLIAILPGA